MGTGKRLLKFGSGSLLGTAVGTAVAVLWAPQSGDELKGRLADRLRRARLAGAEAKAATEEALIRKFRAEVEDPTALRDEEAKIRLEASQAVAAIGLGLNAPGALAAQETRLREAGPVAPTTVTTSPTSTPSVPTPTPTATTSPASAAPPIVPAGTDPPTPTA